MVKSKENLLGAYAFLIGVIFSIFVGLLQDSLGAEASNSPYAILVILGVFVGSLNVGDKESLTFLLVSTVLVVVAGQGQSALIYLSSIPVIALLNSILNALLILFIPATIIVALKTVFSIAKI